MKKNLLISVGVALILLGGFMVWKNNGPTVPPFVIGVAEGEQVTEWSFQGAYTGNAELEAKADADIQRLTGLLGSKEQEDYTLYVSIANQYGLKGDGKNELLYLEKALALNSTTTGLAWHNAGQLFKKLGAYNTARVAFENAATVQPITQYQQVLEDFLKEFPQDTTGQLSQ